jgi:hypothetical protein
VLNSCREATLDTVVNFPSSSIFVFVLFFFFFWGKSQLFVKLGTSQFVKAGECVESQRLQMLVDQQHGTVVESWSLDWVLE